MHAGFEPRGGTERNRSNVEHGEEGGAGMNVQTMQHPTQAIQVEAVKITSREDLIELRASDWHEGQLALLTFPSGVIGFLSPDNPKFFGTKVQVGQTILKGPGGDFEVIGNPT